MESDALRQKYFAEIKEQFEELAESNNLERNIRLSDQLPIIDKSGKMQLVLVQ